MAIHHELRENPRLGQMLRTGFSIVHVAVLPVQPSMAKFVRENISAASHGKPLSYINGLGVVIPNPVRIFIPFIHFRIRELSDRNPVPERKDNLIGNAQHLLSFSEYCCHRSLHLPAQLI